MPPNDLQLLSSIQQTNFRPWIATSGVHFRAANSRSERSMPPSVPWLNNRPKNRTKMDPWRITTVSCYLRASSAETFSQNEPNFSYDFSVVATSGRALVRVGSRFQDGKAVTD